MNPWLILAFVLAFAAGAVIGEWDGARRVDLRWTAKTSQERADGEAVARKQETMWQGVVNGTVRNYEEKVAGIRAGLERDLERLRQRPGRPAAVPASAGADCPCATGAELCREDAAFLGREAARAEKLGIALESCYAVIDGLSSTPQGVTP